MKTQQDHILSTHDIVPHSPSSCPVVCDIQSSAPILTSGPPSTCMSRVAGEDPRREEAPKLLSHPKSNVFVRKTSRSESGQNGQKGLLRGDSRDPTRKVTMEKQFDRSREFEQKVLARLRDIEIEIKHCHSLLCKKIDLLGAPPKAGSSIDITSDGDSNFSGSEDEVASPTHTAHSEAPQSYKADPRTTLRKGTGASCVSDSVHKKEQSFSSLPSLPFSPVEEESFAAASSFPLPVRRPSICSNYSQGVSRFNMRRPSVGSDHSTGFRQQPNTPKTPTTPSSQHAHSKIKSIKEKHKDCSNYAWESNQSTAVEGALTLDEMDVTPTARSDSATTLDFETRLSYSRASDDDKGRARQLLFNGRRSQVAMATWKFLDNPESSRAARIYDRVLPQCLLVSVIFVLMQTLEPTPVPQNVARAVDIVIDASFTLETIIRFLVGSSNFFVFMMRPFNVIDAVSSVALLIRLCCLVPGFSEVDTEASFLCLVAIFRLLKLMRKFQQIHLLFGAFQLAFEALPVLMFMLAVMTLTFASAVYLVEPRDNLESLPKAIWFTMVTMTTVGYGDVVPKSTTGTSIVFVLTVVSVLYMAVPLGIVGQAFKQVWEDRDRILLVKKTQAALVQWGYTANDIPLVFSIFDGLGEGELCLADFRRMMTQMRIGLNDERIIELFHSFDKDGSGYVDDKEFVRSVFPMAYHDLYGEVHEATEVGIASSNQKCSCGAVLVPGGRYCGVCGKSVMTTEDTHEPLQKLSSHSSVNQDGDDSNRSSKSSAN